MKKIFLALMALIACTWLLAQEPTKAFELEKEPKTVLKFREIVPDTLEADLLYDGNLISGKVIRQRYKCTFDFHQVHEGDIFYTLPTTYLNKEGKKLDGQKVLGWKLHGNSTAFIGRSAYGLYGFNPTLNSSTVYCDAGTLNTNSTPSIARKSEEDFLPGSVEFEFKK